MSLMYSKFCYPSNLIKLTTNGSKMAIISKIVTSGSKIYVNTLKFIRK